MDKYTKESEMKLKADQELRDKLAEEKLQNHKATLEKI